MTRYLRFDSNRFELASAITATAGAADANKLIAAASDGLINPALITRASTTDGLGSGSVLGEIRLCTDCLTSLGEGGLVLWTGIAWRTLRDGIAPTTDYLTFFRALVTEGTARASNRLQFQFTDHLFGLNTIGLITAQAGASASAGNQAFFSIPHPGITQMSTGTAATGNAHRGTATVNLAGAQYGAWAACLPALSNATNEFSCRFGTVAGQVFNNTAAFTADGINLIYDRVNATGSLAAGSDNWVVRYSTGTPEYTDTGVAVTSAAATFTFFEILLTPTAHQIYINSNLVFNRTSSFFSGSTYQTSTSIAKSAGTAASILRLSWESYGFYFTSPVNRFAN